MSPKVLNKHKHGVPADAVYVGRGSPWGNPYKISDGLDRSTVIKLFERDVFTRVGPVSFAREGFGLFLRPQALSCRHFASRGKQVSGWPQSKIGAFKQEFFDFLKEVKIHSKETGGFTPLGEHVYGAQLALLDGIFDGLGEDIHDFKVLKSRQLGVSTISRAFSLFWVGMHDGLQGAVIMDNDSNKELARREIEAMIDNLPAYVKFPRVQVRNRYGLILENGSKLQFMSAGTRKGRAGGGLGRSSGLNFVHASEMCSWENAEGVEALKAALSENFPDRLYVWESTARGYNVWHEMWVEAKADDLNQKAIFLGWYLKDNQRLKIGTKAFEKYGKEPPSEKEEARIQAVKELYGYDVDMEQLAWFRQKTDPNQELEKGEEEDPLKRQEQPWCVVANTRVGTEIGLLKITDVQAGVRTALGRVVRSFPTGTAPIWIARTKLGYEIEGTANHPLIGVDGSEVELSNSAGQIVRLQPPMFAEKIYIHKWKEGIVEHSVEITPDIARLVGIFMGDGSLTGQGNRSGFMLSIACTAKDTDFITECHRLVRTLFGVNTQERTIGGCTDVRVTSKLIYETFKGMGLLRTDTGNTRRKVHVPEFIFRSPKHVIREFLRGLFETDGFVDANSNRCALFSKYGKFIQDIQLLLLGFGITSRSDHRQKKNGSGRIYSGHQLELRQAEGAKFIADIGFLSTRKIARGTQTKRKTRSRKPNPIEFQDEVISVTQSDRVEEVFNLTIDGEHWFDANGIVTHNTEDEAFVLSGSSFFSAEKLTDTVRRTASPDYLGYKYYPGLDFFNTRIERAKSQRDVQLKVWEEPVHSAVYVISADPAFGHDEANNHSAVQVLRCYADRVEQVAEFANSSTPTNQFAWVIASLCGWYGCGPNGSFNNDVHVIIELNGPGEAVWNEFRSLKNIVDSPIGRREARERGLANIFSNVRNYVYSRSDAMGPGHCLMWKTTGQLKEAIFERFRDFLNAETILIRSQELLEEMKGVVRDGSTIGAEGRSRDDRTFSMAMGLRAWEERVRRAMTSAGKTKERDEEMRRISPQDKFQIFNRGQMDAFFRKKKMDRINAMVAQRRNAWRYK